MLFVAEGFFMVPTSCFKFCFWYVVINFHLKVFQTNINSHNRKIFHPPVNSQSRTCNCIKKTDCSLQEKCLGENTLYQVDISSKNFQMKIFTTYQTQNLKQDIWTIKNPSATKSTKMTRSHRMNSDMNSICWTSKLK